MPKAVFLDRDGVINRMVYHQEHGILDSPFTLTQFKLLPRVAASVRTINSLGLKAIVVTNQPGIAKRQFDARMLKSMEEKLLFCLALQNAKLDAVYYCLHHPRAADKVYRVQCDCRKPQPGLLRQAARDFGLDLEECYMVGDGITDVQAGSAAGCTTFLVGNHKCDTCRLLSEKRVKPDYIVPDLYQATGIIKKLEGG
jgi:D-glycero-D-manno-heptose 1,7-bisphosphate phosphatase